ncbi:hypothetical protein BRD01_05380 [Halobacteriales archaeon QS_8_65_32]|nr:MAG: hypothetical protein BRD01_05380 [Halobacteriales archaeon QS_8_65_32]
MIGAKRFALAVTVTVCVLAFAAAYGKGVAPLAAYLLAGVFGVLTYSWADQPGGRNASGVLVGGFALGATLSLLVGAAPFVWFLSVPLDVSLWQSWLRLLFPWFGVASALVGGVFLAGLTMAFR